MFLDHRPDLAHESLYDDNAIRIVYHIAPGSRLFHDGIHNATSCKIWSCAATGISLLPEFYDGDLLRFRCQVGHAYSRDSLLASQADMLDQALWASFRALDERANLARRLIRDAQAQNDAVREWRFTRLYEQVKEQKEQVRQALLKGGEDTGVERLVDESSVA